MAKEAMRDANGTPVFARDDGQYATEFPEEHIVERANGDESKYVVYGFVGDDGDYEEGEFDFDDKDAALEFASDIYGSEDVDGFSRDGEVFEVEVHHVPLGE